MNQDNSWALDDPQKEEKLNLIKEQLKAYPWEEIKKDPDILKNAINNNGSQVDPASMLMSERVFMLEQIFEDINKIPQSVDDEVLQIFSSSKDSLEMQQKLNTIVPNLKVKENANNDQTKQQVTLLLNGLGNIKMISFLNIAKQISPYVLILKKFNNELIAKYLSELKTSIKDIENSLDKAPEPKKEDTDKLKLILINLGRTPIETEDLKNQNLSKVLEMAQIDLLALKIINLAYEKNQLNLLEEPESFLPLLIETSTI